MNSDLLRLATTDRIFRLYEKNKYKLFKNNTPYNLNIIGIRADNQEAGKFDDMFVVLWEKLDGSKWNIELFEGTTDPSDLALVKMRNPDGVGILDKGQHFGMWELGLHKGRKDHPCLKQKSSVTVIRDRNRDMILNWDIDERDYTKRITFKNHIKNIEYLDPRTEQLIFLKQEGMFGCNMHRASKYWILEKIGLYSEMCQVHSNYDRYMGTFMDIIKKAVKYHSNSFSYTLLTQSDLENV